MTDEPREADETREADAEADANLVDDLGTEFDEENAFPRMVFRKGTTAKLSPGGLEVDFLVVGNKTALKNALEHGWHLEAANTQEADPREGEEGETPMGEEPYNPRPNEPDNAPFQNTPYVESQSGDAEFASPPDTPVVEPIPPDEDLEKPPPGEEGPPLGGSREGEAEEAEETPEQSAKRRGRPPRGR